MPPSGVMDNNASQNNPQAEESYDGQHSCRTLIESGINYPLTKIERGTHLGYKQRPLVLSPGDVIRVSCLFFAKAHRSPHPFNILGEQ